MPACFEAVAATDGPGSRLHIFGMTQVFRGKVSLTIVFGPAELGWMQEWTLDLYSYMLCDLED